MRSMDEFFAAPLPTSRPVRLRFPRRSLSLLGLREPLAAAGAVAGTRDVRHAPGGAIRGAGGTVRRPADALQPAFALALLCRPSRVFHGACRTRRRTALGLFPGRAGRTAAMRRGLFCQ